MLKINLAYSSSTIHYKPMQWHCILLFPGPGMFAIRAPEEESSEMVEEMDTSEAVWCWYYLAECGVWHMFEVQDISLHLCIPHPSILSLDLSIHSFIIPSIHPPIYCIHPSPHSLYPSQSHLQFVLVVADWSKCCMLCDQWADRTELQQESTRCHGVLHCQVHLQTGLLRYQEHYTTGTHLYSIIDNHWICWSPSLIGWSLSLFHNQSWSRSMSRPGNNGQSNGRSTLPLALGESELYQWGHPRACSCITQTCR